MNSLELLKNRWVWLGRDSRIIKPSVRYEERESRNVWPRPWPSCSQTAHSERPTISPREINTIMGALRTRHLAEGLIAPLIILCCFSYLCLSAYRQVLLPPNYDLFLSPGQSAASSKFQLRSMWVRHWVRSLHHNVFYSTYPQLVSSRLSPTWSEAMPKSAILMLFFSSSNRFSGFRSLWLKDRGTETENI